MTQPDSIQSVFLDQVKRNLPPNLTFADDLAELLAISRDSAYRRIRGETILSLDEVKKICSHYNVSLDVLLSPNDEMVSFHHRRIDYKNFTFDHWLRSVLGNLEMVSTFPEKELFYAAKDVPPFVYFCFPLLASFKAFFWMKSYHRYPDLANQKFKPEIIQRELLEVGRKMWERYSEIPSTEIWSQETSQVTLRQIEYYYQSGILTREQASALLDEFAKMIEFIQEKAAVGNKGNGSFHFYKNDILIAETTILFKMGDKRVSFVTYNTMNLLTTSHDSFCSHIEEYFMNLISKSAQISTTGERERNSFFNQMQDTIVATRKKIA